MPGIKREKVENLQKSPTKKSLKKLEGERSTLKTKYFYTIPILNVLLDLTFSDG